MKKLIFILPLLFFIACDGTNQTNNTSHQESKNNLKSLYKITKEEPNEALNKNNIDVMLAKKVEADILKEIAKDIKRGREHYKKLWIFYHIPNMESGMAWATSHFTPVLAIEILGSTESEDIKTSKTEGIEGEILGKWRNEKSLMGASLILSKNTGGKFMMKITFKDGSFMDNEVKKSNENGKVKFTEENNSHGEYYVVEEKGVLGMYDVDGRFDSAVKID